MHQFSHHSEALGQRAFFAACFWTSTPHGTNHPSVPGQPQNTTHTAGHTIQKKFVWIRIALRPGWPRPQGAPGLHLTREQAIFW